MGSVQSSTEQRRSRRKFTIAESSVRPPSTKEPFLFATEPKHKTKDVKMYHIYGITEAITVCLDISFVKRSPVDGIV